ncbi:MAG TPA: HD domain-containing protein [Candidatus Saccharimonadia bacterium]|nr:HD domain-containing protein [Candidatus Saccharimonadia bacterium]
MPNSSLTDDVVRLSSDLLVPAATTFRTIKLQWELDRFENDAEHSFLLASLGCALAQRLDPALDLGKVSQYALVHDLVEVYAGDTSIWDAVEKHASKAEREAKALTTIEQRFGASFPWVSQTIHAYERLDEPESCFVYALDKIIPYVVMAAIDHQPFPPSRTVYEEKMAIAREKIAHYPALLELFEGLDADYKKRPHFFAD